MNKVMDCVFAILFRRDALGAQGSPPDGAGRER